LKTLTIGISNRNLRFVGMNEKKEISYIDNIDISFSFSDCFKTGVYDETLINEASYIVNNSLRDLHISSTKVGILLDSPFAFLNTVPIDYSETDENISSGILWDLSNYYPETYKNFKINYIKLQSDKYTSNIRDTLVIAIDGNILEVMKKILHSSRIKAQIFDIDHFSVEKYINEIYGDITINSVYGVIGCKRNYIDISIHSDSGLIYYDYLLSKDAGYKEKIKDKMEKVINLSIENPVKSCFFYGDDYSEDVMNYLSNIYTDIKFYLPDPLSQFKAESHIKNSERYKNDSNKFLPLFGMALKQV